MGYFCVRGYTTSTVCSIINVYDVTTYIWSDAHKPPPHILVIIYVQTVHNMTIKSGRAIYWPSVIYIVKR